MRLGLGWCGYVCVLLVLAAGCATTTREGVGRLETSRAAAWSLQGTDDRMTVAVSPTRQTMQMAGLTGAVLGAGISAVADARHRRAVDAVLEDYAGGAVFEALLEQRLPAALGGKLARVEPQSGWAGHKNQREATRARFNALAAQGHDLVLDLQVAHGLYGFEGTLIAKIDGEMREAPGRKLLWKDTLVVSSEEVLASDRLTDPTNRMRPNFRSPRLSVQEDAVSQWTLDGGAVLRARLEDAMAGAVSALLTSLALEETAEGHYHLGRMAMNRREFDAAHAHFERALALAPGDTRVVNAMSVNLAHNGQVPEAIALAEQLAAREPGYGPAQYNLAWWYAVELDAPEQARTHYEQALALDMPEERRIQRALGG